MNAVTKDTGKLIIKSYEMCNSRILPTCTTRYSPINDDSSSTSVENK